jgi:site-specific recombinase XerD
VSEAEGLPILRPEVLPVGFERALASTPEPEGDEPLTEEERWFAERARSANTRRAYRSDLADFAGWCEQAKRSALPASPATLSAYLTYLAGHGAKVPTMSRRLSSIAYAHRFASQPNPVDSPRVHVVWEGIRREQAQPVDQAPPLMPPVLWEVLDALPEDRSGVRDRALLLVGFVGAFRRSELAAMQRSHIGAHPKGLVVTIPRSKTDPYGKGQLVVLPHSSRPERCPVTSLLAWLESAGIADEPEAVEEQGREGDPPALVFRPVHRNGKTVAPRGMSEAAINDAVQRACVRAVIPQARSYSAHSLRAGFATYAAQRGASDRAIAHQTRHRSLASLDQYIRMESAWADNAATALDL